MCTSVVHWAPGTAWSFRQNSTWQVQDLLSPATDFIASHCSWLPLVQLPFDHDVQWPHPQAEVSICLWSSPQPLFVCFSVEDKGHLYHFSSPACSADTKITHVVFHHVLFIMRSSLHGLHYMVFIMWSSLGLHQVIFIMWSSSRGLQDRVWWVTALVSSAGVLFCYCVGILQCFTKSGEQRGSQVLLKGYSLQI